MLNDLEKMLDFSGIPVLGIIVGIPVVLVLIFVMSKMAKGGGK